MDYGVLSLTAISAAAWSVRMHSQATPVTSLMIVSGCVLFIMVGETDTRPVMKVVSRACLPTVACLITLLAEIVQ
jgi:hypothetical protein